jgi:hypothetical protein
MPREEIPMMFYISFINLTKYYQDITDGIFNNVDLIFAEDDFNKIYSYTVRKRRNTAFVWRG